MRRRHEPHRASDQKLFGKRAVTGSSPILETDATLRRFLGERTDSLVEFARALIATPSPNPPGDEREVAALVIAKLREFGVERIQMVGASPEATERDRSTWDPGPAARFSCAGT